MTSRRLEDHGVAGRQRRDAVAERVRRAGSSTARSRRPARAARSARRACGRARTGWRCGPSRRRGSRARAWPRSRTRWRRRRSRRAARPRSVLPVSATIVVDDPLGVVDHPLLGAAQDARAALEAERLPRGLGGAAALGHRAHLVGGGAGTVRDDLAGRRVLDRDARRAVGRACSSLDGGHQSLATRAVSISGVPRCGRSRPSVGRPSSSSTTSMPDVTSPNTVCLPSSHGAASAVTMKNCEPLVFGPGVGHRQRAADDLVLVDLVLERVAGAAGAGALRAAALDHEVLDDAVEDRARRRSRRRRACGSSRPSSARRRRTARRRSAPWLVVIVVSDIGSLLVSVADRLERQRAAVHGGAVDAPRRRASASAAGTSTQREALEHADVADRLAVEAAAPR